MSDVSPPLTSTKLVTALVTSMARWTSLPVLTAAKGATASRRRAPLTPRLRLVFISCIKGGHFHQRLTSRGEIQRTIFDGRNLTGAGWQGGHAREGSPDTEGSMPGNREAQAAPDQPGAACRIL